MDPLLALESLRTEVRLRIILLVNIIQSEDGCFFFSPGSQYWLLNKPARGNSDDILFHEQLGLDDAGDLTKALGRYWVSKLGGVAEPLSFLDCRKFNGSNYITVKDLDNNTSPKDQGSIMTFNNHETVSLKLTAAINKRLPRARALYMNAKTKRERAAEALIPPPSQTLPRVAASDTQKAADTTTTETNGDMAKDIITALEGMAAAHVDLVLQQAGTNNSQPLTNPIEPKQLDFDARQDAPVASSIPAMSVVAVVAVAAAAATAAPAAAAPVPRHMDDKEGDKKMPAITNLAAVLLIMKEIGKKDKESPVNKLTLKKIGHIVHEGIQVLARHSDSVTAVKVTKSSGGAPVVWRREYQGRRGDNLAATSRAVTYLRDVIATTLAGMPTPQRDKVITEAYMEAHSRPLLSYSRRNRVLSIVTNANDQRDIQMAGGMTDRAFEALDRILRERIGVSIRDRQNTMTNMTKGKMVDFKIHVVKVTIKGKLYARQVFAVDRMTDVICLRIMTLLRSGSFIPMSKNTTMADDDIILRQLGDKGGIVQATKFGGSAMTCEAPNGADAFDIFATMDAPDSYANLKAGIFDRYYTELDFYYNQSPKLYVLLHDDDDDIQPLCCLVCTGQTSAVLLPQNTTAMAHDDTIANFVGPFDLSTGGITLLEEQGKIWGVQVDGLIMLDDQPKEPMPQQIALNRRVSLAEADSLRLKKYNLHSFLGGDYEFLHTVLGLQNCSATNPCYLCLVQLNQLREPKKDYNQGDIEMRTSTKRDEFLAAVDKVQTIREKKLLAPRNGSQIRKPLVPANYSQVLPAVLHIILGVVMTAWNNLVKDCQKVDGNDKANERRALIKCRDYLVLFLAKHDEEKQDLQSAVEETIKVKKQAWERVIALRIETSGDQLNEVKQNAATAHKEASAAANKAKIALDARFSKQVKEMVDAIASMVDDITGYLDGVRGKYESVLELIISMSPINAKHNPFYSGSFNGNDCFRLIENYMELFKALREKAAGESDETVKASVIEMTELHQPVFEALSIILPKIRSCRKLNDEEQIILKIAIKDFWEAHLAIEGATVTLKIHHLVFHVVDMLLDRFGTIGLFAEDAIESIHAFVNRYARQYAALDSSRRGIQIFRALTAKKESSHAAAAIANTKASEAAATNEPRQQRKRRKCVVREESTPADRAQFCEELGKRANQFLVWSKAQEQKQTEELDHDGDDGDGGGNGIGDDDDDDGDGDDDGNDAGLEMDLLDASHLVSEALVFCPECHDNDIDRKVPRCLLSLHCQLVHIDAAVK
jgi:hypothetical protein